MRKRALRSIVLAVSLSMPVVAIADWRTAVGYDDLQAEFGLSLADGSEITVMMVEADGGGGGYHPTPTAPQFVNQTFLDMSSSGVISGHADYVGTRFFGTGSLAPEVPEVHIWFTNGINGYFADYLYPPNGVGSAAPATDTARVQNHSYISINTGNPATDLTPAEVTDATLRFDYAIQRDGFVAVVALNNGTGPVPELFGNNYNGITVGITAGVHSRGGTTGLDLGSTNTSGRIKPDIVAPDNLTSGSTPMVSSAATVLLSYADANPVAMANARFNSEVIKAQLLAGATKSEFSGAWQRTTTQPLDTIYGAGELNIHNSYRIMVAGEHDGAPSTSLVPAIVPTRGWDFGATTTDPTLYYFDVLAEQSLEGLSIILTWNTVQEEIGDVVIPDLSLELFSVTGLTTLNSLLDSSDSPIDNVEHIYLSGLLGPGRYAFRVDGDSGFEYALAWTSTAVPEPTSAGLALIAGAVALVRRRRA